MEHGITPQQWHDKIQQVLSGGAYVVITPEEFLVVEQTEHHGEPAYFVYMAAGGIGNVVRRFMRFVPARPWVLWHRRNEKRLRVFRWETLAKKAGG
jgi:hypothetical protein